MGNTAFGKKNLSATAALLMLLFIALMVGCGGDSEQACENKCNMLFDSDSRNPSYQDCLRACLGDTGGDNGNGQDDGSGSGNFPIQLSAASVPLSNKVSLSWVGPSDLTNIGGYHVIRDDEKILQIDLPASEAVDSPTDTGNHCYEVCTHSTGFFDSVCVTKSNRVCLDIDTPGVWAYEAQDVIEIIATNAAGLVCAATDANTVIQINASGQLNWTYTSEGPIHSVAIDSNGNVYYQTAISGSRILFALDPSGGLRWQRDIPDSRPPLVIGGDDAVYFITTDTSHTHLNAYQSDGTQKMNVLVADMAVTTKLRRHGDNFYVGTRNILHSLDMDGVSNWTYTANYSLSSPADERSNVVVVAANTDLIALNSATGGLAWSYRFDRSLYNSGIAVGAQGSAFVSLLNVLYAIDADGNLHWRYGIDGGIGAPKTNDAGVIMIPCGNGRMLFYHQNGDLLWEQAHPTAVRVNWFEVNSQGQAYYGAYRKWIFAVDSHSDTIVP